MGWGWAWGSSRTLPPSERIMRAREGVISGRSVTFLPSLSTKLYICSVISSPPLVKLGLGSGIGLGLGLGLVGFGVWGRVRARVSGLAYLALVELLVLEHGRVVLLVRVRVSVCS